MINSKKELYRVFNDARITSEFGNNVLDVSPNKVENFPCLIYNDSGQNDREFADNKPIASACSVTVDVYTKSTSGKKTDSVLGLVVCDVMRDNFYTCINNFEAPDPTPNVKHRVLEFRKDFLS